MKNFLLVAAVVAGTALFTAGTANAQCYRGGGPGYGHGGYHGHAAPSYGYGNRGYGSNYGHNHYRGGYRNYGYRGYGSNYGNRGGRYYGGGRPGFSLYIR